METFAEPLARLVRDHREAVRFVSDAREACDKAEAHPGNDAFRDLVEASRDLDAFLSEAYSVHAAKEQVVLVAALRNLAIDLDAEVQRMADEQIALRGVQAHLEETLRRGDGRPSAETVATLRAIIERAATTLQEHVLTAERGIFPEAVKRIPADFLPSIERQMTAIDAGLVRWRT